MSAEVRGRSEKARYSSTLRSTSSRVAGTRFGFMAKPSFENMFLLHLKRTGSQLVLQGKWGDASELSGLCGAGQPGICRWEPARPPGRIARGTIRRAEHGTQT